MNKGKIARLVGFVGALGLSTALVATAVQGTGAWFTDSVDGGTLTATSGTLEISSPSVEISFDNLNPGEDKEQELKYRNNSASTTSADFWLVFKTDTAAYGRFTGANEVTYGNGGYDDGGLGQYGHFKVADSDGNTLFESYNLQLPSEGAANGAYRSEGPRNTCKVDDKGHGGSSTQHKAGETKDLAECGVPGAILLSQNVAKATDASATLTFGLTGLAETQGTEWVHSVPFSIVATQPGINPTATW